MSRKVICRSLILVIVAALSLSHFPAQAQGRDQWVPFQFLLGNWSGVGSGKPGEAVASTSFSFDLDKKVIIRKNRVEFPPKPAEKPGTVHEDLMVIYRQPGDSTFCAIYFDNEDHVINYKISFPAEQSSVVFESEGSAKSPRFRLTHELDSDGLLSSEFSIAPPGGEFRTYAAGKSKRGT